MCVKLCTLCGHVAGHRIGQGQVHVVPAHQEVFSHANPFQIQFPIDFGDLDEAQIRGAAAHIRYHDQITHLNHISPFAAVSVDPGIKRGLGLLQQGGFGKPCHFRRFNGKIPGHCVK